MKVLQLPYPAAAAPLAEPAIARSVTEAVEALEDIPLPVRAGKSHDQPDLDVLQVMLNQLVEVWLGRVLGWKRQPSLVEMTQGRIKHTTDEDQSADFALEVAPGKYIVVEVQMANQSRLDSDLRKFEALHADGALVLALWVVMDPKTAARADSGLADSKKAVRRAGKTNLPLVVLCLGDDGARRLDLAGLQGVTLPQMLGGKGGRRSHEVQLAIAEQALDGVPVRDIRLPSDLLELVQSHENAYFQHEAAGLLRNSELALRTGNPAVISHWREAVERAQTLLNSAGSAPETTAARQDSPSTLPTNTDHVPAQQLVAQQSLLF